MTPEEMKAKSNEWFRKKIETPTFELSPIEKPDMSPFLVHLTGKNSLISIIKGEGSPQSAANKGFLRAGIPPYAQSSDYHSPVVCFTESPLFALDFFRFRSSARFFQDQRYGIGFSKSILACSRGVRPVIYLDDAANRHLLTIIKQAENGKIAFEGESNQILSERLKSLKPLMFPLFEKNIGQGYMWEREWRYPNADGFVFNHSDIKVICCPKEEEAELKTHLGPAASQIKFVENWNEYNELISFLKSREKLPRDTEITKIVNIDELLSVLRNYENMLHGLHMYRDTFTPEDDFDKKCIEKAMGQVYRNYQEAECQLNYLTDTQQELIAEWHRELVEQNRPAPY